MQQHTEPMQYDAKCFARTPYCSSTIKVPQSTGIEPPPDGCCHSKCCSPIGDSWRLNVLFNQGRDGLGWSGIWTTNSLDNLLNLLSHSRTSFLSKRSLFMLSVLGNLKREGKSPNIKMPGGRSVFFPCLLRARHDYNGVWYVSSFHITLLSCNICPVGWNSPKHCARGGDFKSVRPGHLAACHSSRLSRCWQTCPTGSGADIGAQIIEASVHKSGKKKSTNQKTTTTTTSTTKTKLLEQVNIFLTIQHSEAEIPLQWHILSFSVFVSCFYTTIVNSDSLTNFYCCYFFVIANFPPVFLSWTEKKTLGFCFGFFFNHNLNSFGLLFAALDCVRRAQQVFAGTCFVTQIVKVIRKKHNQLISHLL